MNNPALDARIRESKGKGAAKRLRRNNQIPAIFYGPKTQPVVLSVDYPELKNILELAAGENSIINLQIKSEQGTDTRKVMIKDLVIDPINDTYLHADFYEISMDREITVKIPIRLLNTPIGVTNDGVLQHIRRNLVISCLPDRLIDFLDIDVAELDIGDSLHVRDLDLPEGIKSLDDAHLTVAVVAAPTVIEEEEEEAEEEIAETEGETAEGEKAEGETKSPEK